MGCGEELIGIVPAGGYGKRMMPFRVWKELIHVGYKKIETDDGVKNIPKIVSEYTVENMIEAGAKKIVMILNEQKFDVFRFFGDGKHHNASIVYTCQNTDTNYTGMPIAIDTAYLWLKDKTVFMGMPDTIVEPFDSFKTLLKDHNDRSSDLTLGVFPTNHPQRLAPVLIDERTGKVKDIFDKPKSTDIYNTWSMAVWSSKFTEFLHNYIKEIEEGKRSSNKEVVLSDVFRAAINEGLKVYGLYFPDGSFHDLGDVNQFISSRIKIENAILSEG